jgi:hypothetical protein
MSIGGVSIIPVLGIINFILLVLQIATGKRWINIPFAWHKRGAIALAIGAVLHGTLAILAD